MKEIRSLTALRGLAALWVCIFHYTLDAPVDSVFMQIARSGFLGVIVFFVLSGYILTYVYEQWFTQLDVTSYVRFMGLRLARVYPLHLLTLLIVASLIYSGIMPLGPNDNLETFNLNLLLLQSWGFTNAISWNAASWSISTEFFCYLFFPIVLWLLHRATWKLFAIVALTAAWWVALYFYSTSLASHVDMSKVRFSYSVSLLNLSFTFLLGVCAYHLAQHLRAGSAMMAAISIAGLGALIYAAISNSDGVIPQIATVLLIVGLSQDSGIVAALMANKLGKFLGDISYALYLIHIPLTHVWTAVLIPTTNYSIWFHMVPLPIRVGVAIIVAAALHYGFEKGARNFIRRSIKPIPASAGQQPA